MTRVTVKIIKDSGKAYLIENCLGHYAWMPHRWVRDDLTVKYSTFFKCNEEFETTNKILLKDTGKALPDYDPKDMVEVLNEDILDIIEGEKGIKESQFAILGIYPPKAGWKERLVGSSICRRRLELAKLSKGINLRNKRIIPCIYDEPRLIRVYEEELDIV